MPSFVDIIGVIEDDEPLDLSAGKETADGDTALPTKNAEPSDKE